MVYASFCSHMLNNLLIPISQLVCRSPPSCVIVWLCVCFLQLPSPGQLSAVRDGALQEGSVPAVLSALAHRQPQRVGWWGGGPKTVFFIHTADGCLVCSSPHLLAFLLSCCLTWTKRFSPWWCRPSSTRGKVSYRVFTTPDALTWRQSCRILK